MTEPSHAKPVRVRDLEATLPDREYVHPGSRLLRRRRRLALVVLILVGVPVWLSAGYAAYLRSAYYREAFLHALGDRIGLTITGRDVRRLGWDSLEIDGLGVSIGGDTRILECDRAVWSRREGPLRSDVVGTGYVLDLIDGWLLIGDAKWHASDYHQLLRSSLGQNLAAMHLAQARLRNIDLEFATPLGAFSAAETRGVVNVEPNGKAVASLDASELNGLTVDEPINIAARFTPGDNLAFSGAQLTIPSVPLRAFAFYDPGRAADAPGKFMGSITYKQHAKKPTVGVTGTIEHADLASLTRKLPGGPYRGRIDLDVREGRFVGEFLESLRASGTVSDLHLTDAIPRLRAKDTTTTLTLDIADLQWDAGRIAYLSATGAVHDVSLEAVSALAGVGRVTGRAHLDIAGLTIANDKLTHADVTIEAEAPEEGSGTIDRATLAYVAKRFLGVDLSIMLPQRVSYERLGVRVIIDGGELRIVGTHGPDGTTLLTVHLFGRSFGLLAAPDRSFPAPDVVAWVKDQLKGVESGTVREWYERIRGSAPRTAQPD